MLFRPALASSPSLHRSSSWQKDSVTRPFPPLAVAFIRSPRTVYHQLIMEPAEPQSSAKVSGTAARGSHSVAAATQHPAKMVGAGGQVAAGRDMVAVVRGEGRRGGSMMSSCGMEGLEGAGLIKP